MSISFNFANSLILNVGNSARTSAILRSQAEKTCDKIAREKLQKGDLHPEELRLFLDHCICTEQNFFKAIIDAP